jgi:lysophospholipase L1-like esterase
MLEDLRNRCRELGLPLLVLGPSRRPDDFWLDRLCVKLDKRLRIETWQRGIPYSDLMAISDQQGERMYRPDGFHLTSSGHAYVADQLEQALMPIVGVAPEACRS